MKVLHLLTALGPGGAETWLLNMLREMDRAECAMDFCLKRPEISRPEQERQALELGAKIHGAPLGPTHVGYVRKLTRILREGRYDVVHSHEQVYSGVGVWTARRLGIPVICTFHHWISRPEIAMLRKRGLRELRELYGRASIAYAMKNASFVSTLSRRVIDELAPAGRPSNWRLLNLSADTAPFLSPAERAAVRRELDLPEEARIILHVGRFIEQKNHAGVLEVFSRVLQKEPRALLVLLGQGPLLEQVQDRITSKGLGPSVRYLGTRADVPRIMGASDVFLFPSLDEGFGLAALEANAAGLPVVGSKVPGLDEAVIHGETAILHALSDVDGMADSVLRFLGDPAMASRFRRAGRERVEREFSHRVSAQKLRALYRECLA